MYVRRLSIAQGLNNSKMILIIEKTLKILSLFSTVQTPEDIIVAALGARIAVLCTQVNKDILYLWVMEFLTLDNDNKGFSVDDLSQACMDDVSSMVMEWHEGFPQFHKQSVCEWWNSWLLIMVTKGIELMIYLSQACMDGVSFMTIGWHKGFPQFHKQIVCEWWNPWLLIMITKGIELMIYHRLL